MARTPRKRRSAVQSMPVTQEAYMSPVQGLWDTDRLVVELHQASRKNRSERTTFHFRFTSTDGTVTSTAATREFTSRFPERKELNGSYGTEWHIPATDVAAMILTEVWPADQVEYSDEARITLEYLLLRMASQEEAVNRSAAYRDWIDNRRKVIEYTVPTCEFVEPYELNDTVPMVHQSVAYHNAADSDGYGLFMEQGTGKTAVVIGVVDSKAQEIHQTLNRMHRTIIVCPKNVRTNWVREFERFSTVHGKVTVLRGGQIERLKQCLVAMTDNSYTDDPYQYSVVVCSYETLCQSWDVIGALDWDLAVLDEGHYIKWPLTKRAQFAHRLRDKAATRMLLTGTPVCNTPIDLYSQLEFLHEGGSGFQSFESFRDFYGVFATQDTERGVRRLVDVQNLPFMRERLARCSFIVRKEDALPSLPEKAYDVIEVEMTDAQQAAYDSLSNQLFAEIDEDLGAEGGTVNANNILTKLLRLAQITSGFVAFDPIHDDDGNVLRARQISRFPENPKLNELMALLADKDPTQKTIIWASFIEDIKAIGEACEAAGYEFVTYYGGTSDEDRATAEYRFNHDPSCRIFIGNPGAGGTGLTLIGYPPGQEEYYDTNCDHVIYYSQDWSHPKRAQSEDRSHRRGTRIQVRVTDLCVPNSIDEEIRARVTNKRMIAMEVQNVREILNRIRRAVAV